MLERIIEGSVRNQMLILLFTAAAIAGGVYAFRNIPVDALPDVSDVQVIIFTEWPGQPPQIVEDQVTYPITTTMLAVANAKVVRGYSFFGLSFVYVIFQDGTDIYWARSRVLEYLSFVQNQLPPGVTPVLGPDATPVGWVFQYALVDHSGKHDLAELRSLQDWYVRYQLQTVPGVANVAVVGGFVRQYQVNVDPNRLLAYDLPLGKVIGAIRRSNNDVGGRVVEYAEAEYMVEGIGYIEHVADLENVPVGADMNGTPILVRDIGYVTLGPDIRRGAVDFDGHGDAVVGTIEMRYWNNALDVIDRVKRKLDGDQARAARGRRDRADLRPLRPHPPRAGHAARQVDRRERNRRHRLHHLPPPSPLRLRRHLHAPGRHPDRHDGHVLAGARSEHHVAGGHRHRHRRHGGWRHRDDRECPQASRARPREEAALGHHRRRHQGSRAAAVLLAQHHRRLVPAGVRPHRTVRPDVRAAGLHQDLLHGGSRNPLGDRGPGPHGLLDPRADPSRGKKPDQSLPDLGLSPRLALGAEAPLARPGRRGRGAGVHHSALRASGLGVHPTAE